MSEDKTTPEVPEAPKFSFIRPLQEMPGKVPAAEPAPAQDDNPDVPDAMPELQIKMPDKPSEAFDALVSGKVVESDPVMPQGQLTQEDLNSFLLECTDMTDAAVPPARITLHLPRNFYKVICALEETIKTYGDRIRNDHMVLRRFTPVMTMAVGAPDTAPMFEATKIAEGTPEVLIKTLESYIMPAEVVHHMVVSTLGRIFEQSRLRMVGVTLVDDLKGIGGFVLMNQHLAPTHEQARMYVEATRNQTEEFKRQAEKRGFTFNDIIVPTAAQVSKLVR